MYVYQPTIVRKLDHLNLYKILSEIIKKITKLQEINFLKKLFLKSDVTF